MSRGGQCMHGRDHQTGCMNSERRSILNASVMSTVTPRHGPR
jgi:hypothetical protein